MQWLNVFKHLLPTGRAWRLTIDKVLRQFFDGLTDLPEDIVNYFDAIFLDAFPQTTRFLEFWETQFALPVTGLTEQERRDRLDGAWKATGGQSPRYIQDTLQEAGFAVFVHDFWDPATEPAVGVQACATVRNPFTYIDDGSASSPMVDGGADAQDGDALAMDGSTLNPVGYLLVNKIFATEFVALGDGSPEMQDGGTRAQDGGGSVFTFAPQVFTIPADPTKFPFFLYIGGETFPATVTLPAARREEFETLCLKICPAHLWLGILVNYT